MRRVEKCRVHPHKPPSPTWKTLLTNHVQDLVARDFFIVPTVTCSVWWPHLLSTTERRLLDDGGDYLS